MEVLLERDDADETLRGYNGPGSPELSNKINENPMTCASSGKLPLQGAAEDNKDNDRDRMH